MKTNLKKALILGMSTLALMQASPALSKTGNQCYLSSAPQRVVIPATSLHRSINDGAIYEDFRGLCLESLSELNVQLRMAHDEWRYGSHRQAVARLHTALKASVTNLVIDGVDIPPQTAVTINNAYRIAKKVQSSIKRNLNEGGLGIQVEFMMLTELINLVNWANNNLDNPYYSDVVDTYISFGNDFNQVEFPLDYFKNVKKLSVKFLSVYDKVQQALASNRVELDIAHSFAVASKSVLNTSVYRRSFCAGLTGLQHITSLIERFQCGQARVPSYRQVQIVRRTMDKVRTDINNTRTGNGYCY